VERRAVCLRVGSWLYSFHEDGCFCPGRALPGWRTLCPPARALPKWALRQGTPRVPRSTRRRRNHAAPRRDLCARAFGRRSRHRPLGGQIPAQRIMEIARGEVWWADLPEADDSSPSGTRPVLVVQSRAFNRSRIQTAITAVITGNLSLAAAPGNVEISPRESGLPRSSVVNVSQLFTIDKESLRSRSGRLTSSTMEMVDEGLRVALGL